MKLDDLVLKMPGDDSPRPRPRPLPPRKPAGPMPAWVRPMFWTLLVAFVFVIGLALGDNAGKSLAADEIEKRTAAEVETAAYKAERDAWETSATALTARLDDLESDLTSATTAAEHWRERAEDASATAAAVRDDNEKLKRDLAEALKKQAVPSTSGTTASATGAWKTAKVSWYGPGFYGRKTASGAVLTQGMMNVAVPRGAFAFGTKIEFRYKGRTCVAVVNDTGAFAKYGRQFDLGPGTAQALGFSGVGTVEWRVV